MLNRHACMYQKTPKGGEGDKTTNKQMTKEESQKHSKIEAQFLQNEGQYWGPQPRKA